MLRTPDEIHAYWFGQPPTTEPELMGKVKLWFGGGPETDAAIRDSFGETVTAALEGKLDDWADTIQHRLALVLVLDQFTRNVFRGDAKTYSGDAKAQALVTDALDRKLDASLDTFERLFFAMPLLHAEDLALQQRVSAYAKEVAATATALESKMCAMHLEQATKYLGVVTRFGRFPHRNSILGRTSTAEEEAFLKDWAANAPPAAARKVL